MKNKAKAMIRRLNQKAVERRTSARCKGCDRVLPTEAYMKAFEDKSGKDLVRKHDRIAPNGYCRGCQPLGNAKSLGIPTDVSHGTSEGTCK